ncbi:hypothetical protein GCM10023194_63720 [Planotetraspora phitsanulokensis]|uniref:Uncharacterized protein n=1 Tax=Planotetraspora phitsanulokensis TaxID=575192 RepID=A0A8J3XP29_9ACTN|nr:hypothetical protein [Planotetraspora phitsanulokensis]GII43473.1 hypothetical protein Pph01_84760 [Planotetraspora phitsanulokensis]
MKRITRAWHRRTYRDSPPISPRAKHWTSPVGAFLVRGVPMLTLIHSSEMCGR